MTWIKPSFLWLMYRAGWGYKDAAQRRVLAIDISVGGFEWALSRACLSHYEPGLPMTEDEWRVLNRESPVKVQWDPERDLLSRPLPYRSIQIGLRGEALQRYVHEWTVTITDVTALAHSILRAIQAGALDEAARLLPAERPYSLAEDMAKRIAATS